MAARGIRDRRRQGRRLRGLLAAKRTIDVILAHVRNGGSLINLCDAWDVPYHEIIGWVRSDKVRHELYQQAMADRSEWTDEMIMSEIRSMCRFDIRMLYREDGTLKDITELDAETARMVQTSEVDEIRGAHGTKLGERTKVKVYDKLKALELAAKNRRLLTDKTEVELGASLADILSKSYEGEPAKPHPGGPAA